MDMILIDFKNIDDELFEKGEIIRLDNFKIGDYITECIKVYLIKISEKQKIKNEIKNIKPFTPKLKLDIPINETI